MKAVYLYKCIRSCYYNFHIHPCPSSLISILFMHGIGSEEVSENNSMRYSAHV